MTTTTALFSDAVCPVRDDIVQVCGAQWDRLGKPGAWFTGVERVAIAAEIRAARKCDFCTARREAVSPYAAHGTHQTASDLPAPIVDVIHRIATDPGRLGSKWHAEFHEAGVSDEQLVEITGIVGNVTVADTFARAVGATEAELPTPEPGEPTRERPTGAKLQDARVPTVKFSDAQGEQLKFYKSVGVVGNVMKSLSLVPEEQFGFFSQSPALYIATNIMDLTFKRSIDRPQIEFIAAIVSDANECFY